MMTSKAKGSGGVRPFRLFIVIAGALLALLLVVRTAAVGLAPVTASLLPPRDATPLARLAVMASIDPRVPVQPQAERTARAAAVSAPLAYEPYFLMSRVADKAGRSQEALALMQEALKRRPNAVPTRMQLMYMYGQRRDDEAAIAQIDYILRAVPDTQSVVFPQLAKALASESGTRVLARILAKNPLWRSDFLRSAAGQPLSSQHAARLLRAVEAQAVRPRDLRPEQNLYLRRLVAENAYGQARTAWMQNRFSRVPVTPYLTNGVFARGEEDGLFGWRLGEGAAGRAEKISGNPTELQLDYFGGAPMTLAEQLLALTPGTYRLSFQIRSDGATSPARLYWEVGCRPGGRPMRIALLQGGDRIGQHSVIFTVPRGCPGQNLAITAEPGEAAGGAVLFLRNVEVRPS